MVDVCRRCVLLFVAMVTVGCCVLSIGWCCCSLPIVIVSCVLVAIVAVLPVGVVGWCATSSAVVCRA